MAVLTVTAATLTLATTTATPAAAYTTAAGSFSGLACTTSPTTNTSDWGSSVPPANAVSATFTIIGGGGAGGDGNGGSGGRGGQGGIVTGTVPVTTGERVWARVGCGGTDADSFGDFLNRTAAGYTRGGPAEDFGGGGGGGSTGLCIGASAAGCSGGRVVAIAAGGGGGGKAAGSGSQSDKDGGSGGDANLGATATSQNGGTGRGGGRGGNGNGSNPLVYGGAGGGGGGQGPGQNSGATTPSNTGGIGGTGRDQGTSGNNAGNPPAVDPGNTLASQGRGGQGANGESDTTGGGGGGGYTGGGGGGGGDDDNSTWTSGGGGGAGASWIEAAVASNSWDTVSGQANCTNQTLGATNAGKGASANNGNRGCHGWVTITYTIGSPPTGGSQTTGNATKGVGLTIGLANADADANNRTCSIVTAPSKGAVALSGGSPSTGCTATYTASANQYGNDSFTYRVTDSDGLVSTTYTVTVPIGNRVPVASGQSLSVDAGSALAVTLSGTDLDGDGPLTCAGPVSGPAKGTLTGSGCVRTYVSSAGMANDGVGGSDSFGFTVADGAPAVSASALVAVTIKNPDLSLSKSHSGRFNPGVGTGTYTLGVANTANATGNGTTTIVDVLPAGMTFRSANSGSSGFSCAGTSVGSTTVTCTRDTQIAKSFTGSLSITVDVVEGASSPVVNTATISSLYELAATAADNTASDATAINGRPTAYAKTVVTAVDVPVTVTLSGTDPDGDVLTFTVGSGPGNGTVSGTGAARQYWPSTGFEGIDTFTYSVADVDGLVSAPVTVTVYVGVSPFSGTVTSDQGGSQLSGIEVYLIDNSSPAAADPVFFGPVVTNAQGQYDLASLFPTQGAVPFGDYVIRFVDPARNFIAEYHLDAATRATAANVSVDAGSFPVTVNASLAPGARIQGAVTSTAAGNSVIDGLQVRLYKIGSPGSKADSTAGGGLYEFDLLTAGQYQLWFRDVSQTSYVSEWYDEATSQATATTITITVGQQVVIDEHLAPVAVVEPPTAGAVTGTVRSATANAAIAGIQVRLYAAPYEKSSATVTNGSGQYSFAGVTAGSYKIWFRDVSSGQWVSEYHNDKTTLANADVVTVGAGGLVVNAELTSTTPVAPANTAVVSGTVTQADGVTPIAGIQVRLYANGQAVGSSATSTAGDGTYAFTGRPPGQYQLWFRDVSSGQWVSEWHQNKTNQTTADPTTLTNNTTTTVNASLTAR